ncbi:MAG: TrkA family potassium uptake protein [Anaerolineae bacterium]|jgi:trk system potassium uptake protein TrkA|nr:TrkA family potassium uptake protein [Anaerolineae bacterium]
MANNRSRSEFAVIGLGRFGSSVALTLAAQGYSVLGVDSDPRIVQKLADPLTQALVLDATDENALRAADIGTFDVAIVAIGSDFESNILATTALKAVGVRRIICKALTERQRSILLRVGADKVVLPESEAGQRLAMELVNPNLLDRLPLGAEHCVVELSVPETLSGKTIYQADLRRRFGVTTVAVKRGDEVIVAPPADLNLLKDDLLVVIGTNANVLDMSNWD